MGAWDETAFGNDDALDFVDDLLTSDGPSLIAETLQATLGEDEPEAPEASQAVAAAEVVAALNHRPSPMLPGDVASWIEGKEAASSDLLMLARRAVHRVASGSELKDLWEDGGEDAKWRAQMHDLQQRLQ